MVFCRVENNELKRVGERGGIIGCRGVMEGLWRGYGGVMLYI